MMKVKMMSGGYIGMIEEWFLSRLEPGDAFTFAGRNLELVMIKEMTAYVKLFIKKEIYYSKLDGRTYELNCKSWNDIAPYIQ